MTVEPNFPLLDEILGQWAEQLGPDLVPYRNHCTRMLNFCFALQPGCTAEEREQLIIAAAFHDLGIWSDGTIDYLPPSEVRARDYLTARGKTDWIPLVDRLIDEHHKLRAYQDARYPLAEVFRKADLVDVSLGLVRFGLPGAFVKEVKTRFPNEGFHKKLMSLAGGWFKLHPLSAPPFIKW